MKTREEFESFVADLTELEMADLLESCSNVIDRNKWGNLRDECIGDGDKIDELQDAAHELDEKLMTLEEEKDSIEREANTALEYLIKGDIEKAKKILSNI